MIDRDGLQVAYLGVALAHYLDLETGEIVDLPLDAAPPGDSARYRRIPTRTPESEVHDRHAFVETVKLPQQRERLLTVIGDANAFRSVLSEDLRLQRDFFKFKNDQATRAIEEWLREEGLV